MPLKMMLINKYIKNVAQKTPIIKTIKLNTWK
jgi:hypothetical protein